MTRINTNVPSLVAQNRLQRSNSDLQTSLTRLSTGLRINTGSDDPAGLIASEALRSEITSVNKAISNTRRANQIISTADSALGQVSNLLNDIRGLVVEAANSGALSEDEIAANQLQVDSSLEAINRIAQSTTFQGQKLLDGSLDFVSTIGSVNTVTDSQIDQANLGTTGKIDVGVQISSAAEQAKITASSSAFSAATAASADVTFDAQEGTLTNDGLNITVRADSGIASGTTIEFVDDGGGAGVRASYDSSTNKITVASDGTTVGEAAISTAIDGLADFSASTSGTATVDFDTNYGTASDVLTLSDVEASMTITADNTGDDYNNVTVKLQGGSANAASYDSDSKTLTVTVDNSAPQTLASLKTVIDSSTDFTATVNTEALLDISNTTVDDAGTGNSGGQTLNDDLIFELSGVEGAETFNFKSGATISQVKDAINLLSDSTDVSATINGSALEFTSSKYGSDALVDIHTISEGSSGTFVDNLDKTRDNGADIDATINGVKASGDGNSFSINTAALDISLTVKEGSSSNFSFSITGGGAKFQMGPRVTSNQQARLGIGSVSSGRLGGASGQLYELGSGEAKNLSDDATGAAKVIDEVIDKVTNLRGRLGAFQRTTLESNLVSLGDTVSNLQEAESSIRDADFAAESANLTRAQILVQSGTNVLAMANQNPQNVLSLLR